METDARNIHVICRVWNSSGATIDGQRLRVIGPVSNVEQRRGGAAEKKHESWKPNECPAQVSIDRGGNQALGFTIYPDAELMLKLASSWSARARLALAKLLWHSLGWQLPAGAKFLIILTLRKRSSTIRPVRIRHRIRINEAYARQMVLKESKAGPVSGDDKI